MRVMASRAVTQIAPAPMVIPEPTSLLAVGIPSRVSLTPRSANSPQDEALVVHEGPLVIDGASLQRPSCARRSREVGTPPSLDARSAVGHSDVA
jgi:hypothetical protein